jgi:hypothetical protein
MSDAKPRRKKQHDYAILGGPTEDGQGAELVRIRGNDVTVGEIRPAREGEPITHSELVRLHPVDAERRICRIEVLHAPEEHASPALDDASARSDAGVKSRGSDAPSRPARVATDRYRKNWDAIFDKRVRRKTWDVN